MLISGKLAPAENTGRMFLQQLRPAVKRAITEITDNEKDASSSEDEESKGEASGKGENAGDQSNSDRDSGERSIDEVEEQEKLMTVEQAEFTEQRQFQKLRKAHDEKYILVCCSGVVDELDLSKVQPLILRQAKRIKSVLVSGKLAPAGNIRRPFLQKLKPAVKRAITEITDNEKDASSSEDEERKGENAGDQSNSDRDSGERSIDEVEEQEKLMIVEQAEFTEQRQFQ